jgi:hypothetical protein
MTGATSALWQGLLKLGLQVSHGFPKSSECRFGGPLGPALADPSPRFKWPCRSRK